MVVSLQRNVHIIKSRGLQWQAAAAHRFIRRVSLSRGIRQCEGRRPKSQAGARQLHLRLCRGRGAGSDNYGQQPGVKRRRSMSSGSGSGSSSTSSWVAAAVCRRQVPAELLGGSAPHCSAERTSLSVAAATQTEASCP